MHRFPAIMFAIILVGFILPWVSVSCAGEELVTASGWQLVSGDAKFASSGLLDTFDLEGEPLPDVSESLPSMLRIAAGLTAVLGLLGLVLSYRGVADDDRGRFRTLGLIGAGPTVLLLAIVAFGDGWLHDKIKRTATDASSVLGEYLEIDPTAELGWGIGVDWPGITGSLTASQIALVIEPGLWLSLLAATGAVGYCWLQFTGQMPQPSRGLPLSNKSGAATPHPTPPRPQLQPQPRSCPNCGNTALRSDARFCGKCGAPQRLA